MLARHQCTRGSLATLAFVALGCHPLARPSGPPTPLVFDAGARDVSAAAPSVDARSDARVVHVINLHPAPVELNQCPHEGFLMQTDEILRERRARDPAWRAPPLLEGAVPVSIRGVDGTILPGDRAVTSADVRLVEAFEAGLRPHVAAASGPRDPEARCLVVYARQYRVVRRRGRTLLEVFFLCERPENWQRREFAVDDGGACYFDVEFDPRTRRYDVMLRP